MLGEGTFHLAVFDLARIKYLLEQSRLFDPLVDTDCRGREQEDHPVQVGRVDDLFDGLRRGWRIQRCLVIRCEGVIDVFDDSTVVLADRDRETALPFVFVVQCVVAGRDLDHLTFRIHVVLQDHVQLVQLDLIVILRQNVLAASEDCAVAERTWDLDRVQVGEGFEGPDPSCPIERHRHK